MDEIVESRPVKDVICFKLPILLPSSRTWFYKTKVVDVLQFIINEIFDMMLSKKVVKYFLWCGCEAYDALSLFPRLQKTFFFCLIWVELKVSHAFDGPHYTHNNKTLGSHWLQIRSRNARLHVRDYNLCACASLTFVWAHLFQESLFVGAHLF